MRKEKTLYLENIQNKIQESSGVIVLNYDKIQPDVSWESRKKLSDVGASFDVVKKRILAKAAQSAGFELSTEELKGHIGIVYAGKDTIQTAKTVYQISKENNNLFKVLMGYIDNQILSSSELKTLSELPSEKELKAQLLGLFEAPASQTVSVIQNILTSVIFCLQNKAEKS